MCRLTNYSVKTVRFGYITTLTCVCRGTLCSGSCWPKLATAVKGEAAAVSPSVAAHAQVAWACVGPAPTVLGVVCKGYEVATRILTLAIVAAPTRAALAIGGTRQRQPFLVELGRDVPNNCRDRGALGRDREQGEGGKRKCGDLGMHHDGLVPGMLLELFIGQKSKK